MKQKIVLGIILVLGVCVLTAVGLVMRDAKRMAWSDYTESRISVLATYVEDYKDQHGGYPAALEDLLKEPGVTTNDVLIPLVSGREGTRYEYRPSSNSFWITASRDGGWLSKSLKLEKQYRAGEPSKWHSRPVR